MQGNKFLHYLGNAIKLFSVGLSMLIFLQIIVIRNLYYFFPDSHTILNWYKSIPESRFVIISLLILTSVAWLVAHAQKLLRFTNPFRQSKEEIGTLTVASMLFAYYFYKSFNIFGPWNNLSFVILTLVFITIITQFFSFYKTYSLHDVSEIKDAFYEFFTLQHVKDSSKKIYILFIFIVLLIYSIYLTTYLENQKKFYLDIISGNLFITNISPQKTTFAYDVTLEGFNFGEVHDIQNKLMSSRGKIVTSFWTDHKITFTVPLDWDLDKTAIWIEKPHPYNKSKIITSNIVNITILDRWQFFPEPNDNLKERVLKRIKKVILLDYKF